MVSRQIWLFNMTNTPTVCSQIGRVHLMFKVDGTYSDVHVKRKFVFCKQETDSWQEEEWTKCQIILLLVYPYLQVLCHVSRNLQCLLPQSDICGHATIFTPAASHSPCQNIHRHKPQTALHLWFARRRYKLHIITANSTTIWIYSQTRKCSENNVINGSGYKTIPEINCMLI